MADVERPAPSALTAYTGRLSYLGWFNRPWTLAGEGDVDLWPVVEAFMLSLSGKRARHTHERDGYHLGADPDSLDEFEYRPGEICWLHRADGSFGMSNVHAYLDSALVWLSGRLVNVVIEPGHLRIAAEPSERVHGVYFTDGNACGLSSDEVRDVCRPGPDACVFLSAGASGFMCQKFSGMTARHLLDRLAKGTMNARRIGSCTVLGRREESAATGGSAPAPPHARGWGWPSVDGEGFA